MAETMLRRHALATMVEKEEESGRILWWQG
jgi:hypothetical protein